METRYWVVKLSMKQVLLLLNYCISFYMIFRHISQNLLLLREQLTIIEDEDVHAMRDAIFSKYIMFKYAICSAFLLIIVCNTLWFSGYMSCSISPLYLNAEENLKTQTINLLCLFVLARKFQGAMHIVAMAEFAVSLFCLYFISAVLRIWNADICSN